MFQLRAYLLVLTAVGLLGALFFGAHWIALPKELTKSSAQAVHSEARYVHSRWPQVRFVREDGTFVQASCGRVRPLCNSVKGTPIKNLEVWFTSSFLGEEPWIVAVESSDRVFLSESAQRAAFAEFRSKPAVLAFAFLALSCISALFARRQVRSARPNPSFNGTPGGAR